jgi:hypothetical protein
MREVFTMARREPATAKGHIRALFAGGCLLVLLTGCSLDVGALRENIETHWAGVESTSPPTPSPASTAAPTPDGGTPAGVESSPEPGPVQKPTNPESCPRGGEGACRV